ncbi:MAG: rhomboid family intramembrane serine protease [Planctomycetota bacterium]|nr:rhomboid family intramembrane serine protease [Planctomycetota bacterium]
MQWFSSLFLHVGIVHLIGNMIFLWTFGLIVEGKVGLTRFLLIYLIVGMTESAISQLPMLGGSGAAVGASGAIFGLLAISLVWSPKNELTVVFLGCFYPLVFDITVLMFGFVTIGWELIQEFLLIGVTKGKVVAWSAFFHILGALVGFSVGWWMLKNRHVDCEGFDLVSVWSGNEGRRVVTLEKESLRKKRKVER